MDELKHKTKELLKTTTIHGYVFILNSINLSKCLTFSINRNS